MWNSRSITSLSCCRARTSLLRLTSECGGTLAVDKALADQKRHPTLEDRVVVYANATILGGSTVIGHDSVIGGNAWITASVPPFSLVSRKSEVRVRAPDGDTVDLEFHI